MLLSPQRSPQVLSVCCSLSRQPCSQSLSRRSQARVLSASASSAARWQAAQARRSTQPQQVRLDGCMFICAAAALRAVTGQKNDASHSNDRLTHQLLLFVCHNTALLLPAESLPQLPHSSCATQSLLFAQLLACASPLSTCQHPPSTPPPNLSCFAASNHSFQVLVKA